jgi:hypothetical protein
MYVVCLNGEGHSLKVAVIEERPDQGPVSDSGP